MPEEVRNRQNSFNFDSRNDDVSIARCNTAGSTTVVVSHVAAKSDHEGFK